MPQVIVPSRRRDTPGQLEEESLHSVPDLAEIPNRTLQIRQHRTQYVEDQVRAAKQQGKEVSGHAIQEMVYFTRAKAKAVTDRFCGIVGTRNISNGPSLS